MAENIITIEFVPCEPAPVNGYLVKYRPFGSLEDYRVLTPNQTESPIVIVDNNDPAGESYEGTIQGDCGGGVFGVASSWEFTNDQSQSGSISQSESDGPPPTGKNVFLVNETGANIQVITDFGTFNFAPGVNGPITIFASGFLKNNSGATWKFTFIQSMPSTLSPLESPNPDTLTNLASHVFNADVSTVNYVRVAAP